MRSLIFFICVFGMASCKQEATPTTDPAPVSVATGNQDTISQQTFLNWTTTWDSLGKAFTDTLLVQYFDMPVIDLKETLGENPSKARFYNGLEDKGKGHYEAHLILTAVGEDGKDKGQYFDITQPCPPICKPK